MISKKGGQVFTLKYFLLSHRFFLARLSDCMCPFHSNLAVDVIDWVAKLDFGRKWSLIYEEGWLGMLDEELVSWAFCRPR